MTRKHFEALAEEISYIDDDYMRLIAALAVARACARFNPNFDRLRFIAACGVTERN